MKRFLSLTSVVLVLAAGAIAQTNGGGGQGGRQGRGGFGRNQANSMTGLLSRPDVRGELKLTDEQKTKLTELGVRERGAGGQGGGQRGGGNGGNGGGQGGNGGNGGGQAGGQRGQGGQGGAAGQGGQRDPEAMRKAAAEREKNILAVLTETQVSRLKELFIQRVSFRAITREDIQTSLKMTDEQKTKVKDLIAKQAEANQSLMSKMRSQEITREEFTEAMQKNDKALTEELGKVLTDPQKAAFSKMGGAEFKFDEGN